MKVQTDYQYWVHEERKEGGEIEYQDVRDGLVVTGSFIDYVGHLDLDERQGVAELVKVPAVEIPDNPVLAKRIRKQLEQSRKESESKAYQQRQEEIRRKLIEHIDQALDARPEIDLSGFHPGEMVSLSKNRKTRKISFVRRYRPK